MAIAPAIGLGLSAIGTVASISQQSKQARVQSELAEQRVADAKQTIRLAQDEMRFVREQAARVRDQELQLNSAQKQSSMQQIVSQMLEQQLAQVQAQTAASGTRLQSEQVANQLLTQGVKEKSAVNEQQAGELKGLTDEIKKVGSPSAALNSTQVDRQDRANRAIEAARGDLSAEQQARQGLATQNLTTARNVGAIQMALGDIAATGIEQSAALQQKLFDEQIPHAQRAIQNQAMRNRMAIQSKYYSTAATATLTSLSQQIQGQNEMRAAKAQAQSIDKPGFLSYLNAAGGLFNQGLQSGVITFNNRVSPVDTARQNVSNFGITQSPLLDMLSNQGLRTDVTNRTYG